MSDDSIEVPDMDLDSPEKLKKTFPAQFTVQHEQSVSLKQSYIVHLSQFAKSQVVAAAITGNTVFLYDLASGRIQENLTIQLENKGQYMISGIKCHPKNDNELFVCSTGGQILLYDTRTADLVNTFTEPKPKPYTCFDLNSNGRLLCAGTEEVKTDVFLNFFDVRKASIMGGYFESHEKDVSQVKFHPNTPNLMATGSLDGLINVFDTSETDEDDALQCTFNTDRSVSTLNWHKDDLLSCITDSNEVLFHDVMEMDLVAEFSRDAVTEKIRRNCASHCHTIGCHTIADDRIAVLASSNYTKGCLRTLTFDAAGKSLQPHANFAGNRQLVRCSFYNATHNYFLTGGEGGVITLWSEDAAGAGDTADTQAAASAATEAVGKVKKAKAHKSKPY